MIAPGCFYIPTVAPRSSGWSCRNKNCLRPEVISQSTSKRLITISASCRSQRNCNNWISVTGRGTISGKKKQKIKGLSHQPTLRTSSSEKRDSADSFSTAPQFVWKELARKWATPGATPQSEPSSCSCAKTNSNRETLQQTHSLTLSLDYDDAAAGGNSRKFTFCLGKNCIKWLIRWLKGSLRSESCKSRVTLLSLRCQHI